MISAIFVKRHNRFVSSVKLDNKEIKVYVPNTGRLSELAIPGNKVLLIPSRGKYKYRLLYIYHNNFPVMIDSAFSNTLFRDILIQKRIPYLKDHELLRTEPGYKNRRFDFLLKDKNEKEYFIELKSCTLAWRRIASFPDAISSRASSHVEHLAEAGNGILVFFILHRNIKYFVPNYHTDFEFYIALKKNQSKIKILAYSIDYNGKFEITKINKVPVKIPDVKPTGSYLIILYNNKQKKIKTGSLGVLKFQKGYYVYVGSGMNNVFKRIARHRQKGTKKQWHIDYIKEEMKITADIPIVRNDNIECILPDMLISCEGIPVKNFGSSDCKCESHLYYFSSNPMETHKFWDHILKKRWEHYI